MKSVPLSQAPAGADCCVVEVDGDGAFLARMREMGIEVGGQLRVVQRGRSMLLDVGTTRLALRAREADAVTVAADAPPRTST